jgi:hypothetical protein
MLEKLRIPPHVFVSNIFLIDGRKPDFKSFFYMKALFDLNPPKILLYKTARQVAKSTYQAINSGLHLLFRPYFSIIHVSPSERQMRQFVDGKLNPIWRSSPLIKGFLRKDNEQYKEFKNESKIYLRFARYNADSIRGLSADEIMYDEVQDILWDVIPIINECTAQSDYGWKVYAGTPKTRDNTIEFLWQRSKQLEWAIPCQACGKWNVPAEGEDMLKMIGKEGPICMHCGKPLYPPEGQWVVTNPDGKYPGFHVPQIIRWHSDPAKRKKQWEEVLEKLETYPQPQFFNEVLGVSVDVGATPLTKSDIESAKYPLPMTLKRTPEYKLPQVFMGVDWGITAERSFTVVTIGATDTEGKFKVLWAKRFYETDLLKIVDEIVKLYFEANVSIIGADFGAGATNNQLLRQKIGRPEVVVEYVYTTQTDFIKRKTPLKFSVDRTQALERIVYGIREKRILFPRDLGEELYKDLLALREETTRTGKKVYIHNPNEPDDFAHSLTFCWLTDYLWRKGNIGQVNGLW